MAYSTYDRNFIRDFFIFASERINSALCIGRKKDPDAQEVYFALTFFLHLNAEELEYINSLVEEKEDEVLIEFFKEVPGKSSEILTKEEMATFDFSRKWKAHRMCTSWDELREVGQNMMAIVFE